MSISQKKTLIGMYRGERTPLFKLAFTTSLLTLLTLGIYRFWAKTRIRKYIWSSTSANSDTFEYTGTGLEKFLGFLVAIVILAIYLGVVQMILFFFGVTLFAEPQTQAEAFMQFAALFVTMLAVAPLVSFAKYRARRYKLARTRWRGIRFGAEQAAWPFAGRDILYSLITVLSFGILLPLRTFKLEKFKTDRTWYGDVRFQQNGKWTALYPAMKHLMFGVGTLVGLGVLGGLTDSGMLLIFGTVVGYIWAAIGYVYYRVHSFVYFVENVVLGDAITFSAAPRTEVVVTNILVGGLICGLILAGVSLLVGVLSAGILAVIGGSEILSVGIVVLTYLVALAMAGALSLVWVLQPIIDHLVGTVIVSNAELLDDVRQRESDTGADAEGFADALDIGGAI